MAHEVLSLPPGAHESIEVDPVSNAPTVFTDLLVNAFNKVFIRLEPPNKDTTSFLSSGEHSRDDAAIGSATRAIASEQQPSGVGRLSLDEGGEGMLILAPFIISNSALARIVLLIFLRERVN